MIGEKMEEKFPEVPARPGIKGVHLDAKKTSVQLQKVIEGEVIQKDGRTYLEFDPAVMQATVSADVCGWEAEIYIDAVQWGRRDDGSMTVKVHLAGCSNSWVGGLVTAAAIAGSSLVLQQATASPILPAARHYVPVLNAEDRNKLKDIPVWTKV